MTNAPPGLLSVTGHGEEVVLAGRDRWREVHTPGGTIDALLPPATLAGVEPRLGAVPALGAHSEAVLRELGYSDDAIADLVDGGVTTTR